MSSNDSPVPFINRAKSVYKYRTPVGPMFPLKESEKNPQPPPAPRQPKRPVLKLMPAKEVAATNPEPTASRQSKQMVASMNPAKESTTNTEPTASQQSEQRTANMMLANESTVNTEPIASRRFESATLGSALNPITIASDSATVSPAPTSSRPPLTGNSQYSPDLVQIWRQSTNAEQDALVAELLKWMPKNERSNIHDHTLAMANQILRYSVFPLLERVRVPRKVVQDMLLQELDRMFKSPEKRQAPTDAGEVTQDAPTNTGEVTREAPSDTGEAIRDQAANDTGKAPQKERETGEKRKTPEQDDTEVQPNKRAKKQKAPNNDNVSTDDYERARRAAGKATMVARVKMSQKNLEAARKVMGEPSKSPGSVKSPKNSKTSE